MLISPKSSRVSILVKALPQPSKQYGETVCCAGVTSEGQWKRIFPIRFRHLQHSQIFKRWNWVKFNYRAPTRDRRLESCHAYEDSIVVDGIFPEKERAAFFNRIIVGSAEHASANGQSLALIRPRNTKFTYKAKSKVEIASSKEAFQKAAKQGSFFDQKLANLEPSPYEFKFTFEDDSGKHSYQDGDWETHAMFFRERNRKSEQEALRWMSQVFNEHYPKKGMVFAIGNMASRPQTWQLLGVIRLDITVQSELSF